MCEIDFDGYCDVWRESTHKARKPYKCSSCGGPIDVGQEYVYHFDVFEGEANKERCCMECDADRQTFCKAHSVKIGPRSFGEYLSECVYDGNDADQSEWRPMLDRLRKRQNEVSA